MSSQDHLSASLRQLRTEAGLSGTEAARQTGLSQSKVSRMENGVFMPTAEQVDTLCRVYRAPAATRRELVQVTRDIRAEASSARVVLQRGAWRMQQRIGRIEAESARIRSFQPTIVIGLLQTPAYSRGLFGEDVPADDLDRFVAARGDRQQLLDTDREFTFVLTEGALRWHIASPAIMADQMEHLDQAAGRPAVRLGVIPWTTPTRVPPLHGFRIFDARAVEVGTETATAIITDGRDVVEYEKRFAEYEALAVFGDQARSLIRGVGRDFRRLAR